MLMSRLGLPASSFFAGWCRDELKSLDFGSLVVFGGLWETEWTLWTSDDDEFNACIIVHEDGHVLLGGFEGSPLRGTGRFDGMLPPNCRKELDEWAEAGLAARIAARLKDPVGDVTGFGALQHAVSAGRIARAVAGASRRLAFDGRSLWEVFRDFQAICSVAERRGAPEPSIEFRTLPADVSPLGPWERLKGSGSHILELSAIMRIALEEGLKEEPSSQGVTLSGTAAGRFLRVPNDAQVEAVLVDGIPKEITDDGPWLTEPAAGGSTRTLRFVDNYSEPAVLAWLAGLAGLLNGKSFGLPPPIRESTFVRRKVDTPGEDP